MPRLRRSPYLLLLLAAAGCESPPSMPPPPRDSGPRDSPIADAPLPDAPREDGAAPADAAIDRASCTLDSAADLMAVGRDSDRGRPPILSASASATELVAVFADDLDGALRIQAARATIADHTIIRQALAAPDGASSPSILAIGGDWLLAYVSASGEVFVQRLDGALAANGAPRSIASRGSLPRLGLVGSGAYVAWRDGARAMGRALGADGAPAGAAVELFALPAADARIDVAGFGAEGRAIVARAGAAASPARVIGRTIEASGEAAAGTSDLGSTTESAGAIALGGAAPRTTAGYPPLDGAAVWDVDVGGFEAVRFLLLDASGAGPFGEFTVSEGGEPAWGGALVPLGTGYLAAYREQPSDGTPQRVRVAIMDRDACRLGRVDRRQTITVTESATGSGITLAVSGDAVLLAWAETLSDVVEYRVASARCGGGS